jgi:cation transport ATPase
VSTLVLFLLATPIQFAVGWPLYDSAYRALRYGHNANADTLVMLSTSIAYFYSIIATICALAGSDFTGSPTLSHIVHRPLSRAVSCRQLCSSVCFRLVSCGA